MITDNQAREAINTIADYCSQLTGKEPCKGCVIRPICREFINEPPENWPEYMEKE